MNTPAQEKGQAGSAARSVTIGAILLTLMMMLAAPTAGAMQTVSVGQADDTPGVFLYSAASASTDPDPDACAGEPATDPSNGTIDIANQLGALALIGDEVIEVGRFTPGGDTERVGGLRDTTITDVVIGLGAIDDYGFVGNSSGNSDDSSNLDAGTGGSVVLLPHLGGTPAMIVADGVVSAGTLSTDPGDPFGNLDGAEIFLFEDAALSGFSVVLEGQSGASIAIAVDDLQRNPRGFRGSDDFAVAIDLDSLPGWGAEAVIRITVTDDNVLAPLPGRSNCPENFAMDTSLEIDAVAARADVLVPLQSPTSVSIGQADDTPGVYLFAAGLNDPTNPTECVGAAGQDPSNVTIQYAVDSGVFAMVGDEAAEVTQFTPGADIERAGGTRDTTIADANQGLTTINDFGTVAFGSDDSANLDVGTGGSVTLVPHLLGAPAMIIADGERTSGMLGTERFDLFGNLNGIEIFIFEDAELSGSSIRLETANGAPITIDISDYQRNPNTTTGADDIAIGIDLDSLPGWNGQAVTRITITDDNQPVPNPGFIACPNGGAGDTALEIDAVAVRTDVLKPLTLLEPAVDIEVSTNGVDADMVPGVVLQPGDIVIWDYVITNTGTSLLSNVRVASSNGAQIDCGAGSPSISGTLAPGATVNCTAATVAVAGQVSEIGQVLAVGAFDDESTFGLTVEDNDLTHYFGAEPGIDIELATNGEDADVPPGVILRPGDAVHWDYAVTNVGNTPLRNFYVSSSGGLTPDCGNGTNRVVGPILPGASFVCTATGVAIAGEVTVTGTAAATPSDTNGNTYGLGRFRDRDVSNYSATTASIELEKRVNGQDADAAPGPTILVGDTVIWDYTITNTGDVPLRDLRVADNALENGAAVLVDCGDGTNAVATLAVGATIFCTASFTEGSFVGLFASRGIVSALPPTGASISDEDTAHHFVADPSLIIEVSTNGVDGDTPPGVHLFEGEPVHWDYVVTNTGNVPLMNVFVKSFGDTRPDCGNGSARIRGPLAPGATAICTATGFASRGLNREVGAAIGIPTDTNGDRFGAARVYDLDRSFFAAHRGAP